jgi:post-segregation antitoxin (ccd killing protein)
MPKVSVYLPDHLYQEARARGLSVSSLAQDALRQAIEADDNTGWLARARERIEQRGDTERLDTAQLMDDVRAEFGA